jgi:isopenicillin N synthase-like dioxygenase
MLDGTNILMDLTPNTIIVNVGDMLRLWTNNVRLGSNPLRDGNDRIPERFFMTFFLNPNEDAVLQTVTACHMRRLRR